MRQRHAILMLLTSLAALTYLDRLCIAALGPTMQEELELSPVKWGWVMGAFTVAYSALEIPSGAWGDRFGRRRVLTRIVLWWSGFTVLTGMVTGFVPLLIVRFLFGAGEAGAFPNISGAASRSFSATERARVQGIVWGASRLGALLTPMLVGTLLAIFGSWRVPFWIFGSAGLVWVLAWRHIYRDDRASPPQGSGEEWAEVQSRLPPAEHLQPTPWRRLLLAPRLWLIMVMYSCYVWGSTFYLTWLHTYLVKGRGFSEEEMWFCSSLPFLLGAICNPLGGMTSDALSRRFGLKMGRRLVGSSCLAIGALLLLMTSLTTERWTSVALLAIGFGVLDFMLPSAWAVCMDVGGRHAGAVSGAMNSFGNIGGTLCTVMFGYLVEYYASYNAPLILISVMVLLSAILFAWIDPSRPLLTEDQPLSTTPAPAPIPVEAS